ncbi:nucleoside monophosphate kinase [Candidatus Gracilibacteria bacterium]|nr:nucleoside monophosphate kinase [Candidatus Gracilibacteria bacterium]
MNDLILVGIQGSGKGTQARILAEKFGYQIFETGGELRNIAKEESELGRKVKEITERGDLVPNEIVMEIVENFLSKVSNDTPVIFDGIPRSDSQRISLEDLLNRHERKFSVLEVKLSEKESMQRMMKRAEIENRADDTPEVMKKRIANFYTHTQPLLDAWKDRLITVDGDQPIEEVSKEILEKLNLVSGRLLSKIQKS